jgi:hypothetical protein
VALCADEFETVAQRTAERQRGANSRRRFLGHRQADLRARLVQTA